MDDRRKRRNPAATAAFTAAVTTAAVVVSDASLVSSAASSSSPASSSASALSLLLLSSSAGSFAASAADVGSPPHFRRGRQAERNGDGGNSASASPPPRSAGGIADHSAASPFGVGIGEAFPSSSVASDQWRRFERHLEAAKRGGGDIDFESNGNGDEHGDEGEGDSPFGVGVGEAFPSSSLSSASDQWNRFERHLDAAKRREGDGDGDDDKNGGDGGSENDSRSARLSRAKAEKDAREEDVGIGEAFPSSSSASDQWQRFERHLEAAKRREGDGDDDKNGGEGGSANHSRLSRAKAEKEAREEEKDGHEEEEKARRSAIGARAGDSRSSSATSDAPEEGKEDGPEEEDRGVKGREKTWTRLSSHLEIMEDLSVTAVPPENNGADPSAASSSAPSPTDPPLLDRLWAAAETAIEEVRDVGAAALSYGPPWTPSPVGGGDDNDGERPGSSPYVEDSATGGGGPLRAHANIDNEGLEATDEHGAHEQRQRRTRRQRKKRGGRIRRVAVLRPFGARMASVLPETFADWSDFVPCDLASRSGVDVEGDKNGEEGDDGESPEALADLFLSFSQRFEDHPLTAENVRRVLEAFQRGQEESAPHWAKCFGDVRVVSASIPRESDLYEPSESERNPLWVNGPNRQFVASVEQVSSGDYGEYDAMFVMEGDCVPVREYWLDDLLDEADDGEEEPFAILGSKYDGDSWDKFRSSLPLSLQHHLNGNAVYNTTHPLLLDLVRQLDSEANTPYNAVPYDYRISQILVEGMLGVKPEIPPDIVAEYVQRTGRALEDNTDKFRTMWEDYGGKGAMRESSVISNYAGTNLLPRHVRDVGASIVHGAKHYLPWDPKQHNITLVVTEWHHELSLNLLSRIDDSDHPFSNVLLLVPSDLTSQSERHLSMTAPSSVGPVTVQRRGHGVADYMDLCEANVETEWFMITNSYHAVADHVDLLFTQDYSSEPPKLKPVLPYTPADERHCLGYPACREARRLAREFHPAASKIVLDFDALFETARRDEFCKEWIGRYGPNGERLYNNTSTKIVGPKGPTATSYVAHLASSNALDSTYGFTDRTVYGSRESFVRVFSEDEENAAANGDGSALSNRILREGGGTGLSLPAGGEGAARKMRRAFRRRGDGREEGAAADDEEAEGDAFEEEEASAAAAAISRTQVDPTLELRMLQDNEPSGFVNTSPTSSPSRSPSDSSAEESDPPAPTPSPSAVPSAAPTPTPAEAAAPTETSVDGSPVTPMPSSVPSAVPSAAPQGGGHKSNPSSGNRYRCRSWCSKIPVPWFSDDPAEYPKCQWKYSCSGCDSCTARRTQDAGAGGWG